MNYVDGFVIPVPKANREAYRQIAADVSERFKEWGALQVVECWGDDVPQGKLTSFPMAVQCGPDEVVVFSWIVWPSKAVRDEGQKRMMAEPMPDSMPFDGKRMIFGGFEVLVDA